MASRGLRSLLTAAGIALGVAVVFSALAIDKSIEGSVERTTRDLVGRADLQVRAFEEPGLSAATLATVRATDGVALASPFVELPTFVQTASGADLGTVTVFGVDPRLDPQVHEYSIAQGVFLGTDTGRSVVVAEPWARDHRVGVGDELTFQAHGLQASLRIIGLLGPRGAARFAGGQVAFVTLPTAQELAQLGDAVTRIDVRLADGVAIDDVQRSLEANLRSEPYVLSTPAEIGASLRGSVADFNATTVLLAAIALFVGGFLIYNTLSMSVAERIREIGLLRAGGATRSQIHGLFLLEAILLGLLGSAVGLALGIALAEAMAIVVRATGAIPLDSLALPPAGAVLALLLGVFVTVAAALRPAWRAGAISPVEALRSRSPRRSRLDPRLGWVIGINAVVALAGIGLWPLVVGGGEPPSGLGRPLVVFGLLLVVAVLSPLLLGPLGRLAGLPFALFFRAEGRLARGTLVRDRGRAALTLGALTVGLAMVVAIGTWAENARRAGLGWIQSTIPGELVVRALNPVGLDFASDFRAVPGVASVTPLRTFDIDLGGHRVDAVAIEPQAYQGAGALQLVEGDRTAAFEALARGGAVLVPQVEAQRLGVSTGERISVATRGGAHDFSIAGIVARSFPGSSGEALLFGWRDASEVFGLDKATLFAVRSQPGGSIPSLQEGLERVAVPLGLRVYSVEEVAGVLAEQLGRVFGFFDVLALAALVVAALGIVNTLTMNVYERIREIGILRATGMTRRGIWRMVVVEAGVLGLAGSVLGVVAGVAIGLLMLVLARTPGFQPPLEVPWPAVFAALALGVALAMLAAYYPARVASGITIVRAVRQQ